MTSPIYTPPAYTPGQSKPPNPYPEGDQRRLQWEQDWSSLASQQFFRDVFESGEEGRRGLFRSFEGEAGKAPAERDYFKNAFQDIHNRFLGALGSQVRAGETPDIRFEDYLNQQFNPTADGGLSPFTERFRSLPPSSRPFGGQTRRFAPRTRKLFSF